MAQKPIAISKHALFEELMFNRAENRIATTIAGIVLSMERKIDKMSAEMDELVKEVTETSEAVASVIALVEGLAQQIRDNANAPAQLLALAAELEQRQQELANAASAATQPAPPTPTP